jgi:hypothetical protein
VIEEAQMLHRDGSIVHTVHAERTANLYGHGPERRLAGRPLGGRARRALGRSIVRLGAWLADPAHPAQARPRVPSSTWEVAG